MVAVRLLFCGTPAFAVPTFHALLAAGHTIELTLCQPDRPVGRGLVMTAPPIKRAALEAGIEVLQPEKVRNNAELRERLATLQFDVTVIVAYGRILPPWMLALPRLGNVNLHGSLLPKYRGAAPIQWAIANGEAVTGVTTMLLNEGMDTGDMLLRREVPIRHTDTAEDLFVSLAAVGAPLVVETLAGLAAGTITPEAQDHSAASMAPMLSREDGRIDTARSARSIYDRWRGFQPWPGAWTTLRGKKLTLHGLALAPDSIGESAGMLRVDHDRLFFRAGDGGVLEVLEAQVEGKRRMPAADLLHGHVLLDGDRLGS